MHRNLNRKRIILLLDESGSMMSQKHEVISGVNEMISQQRRLQTEPINFSIIKFNSQVSKIKSDLLDNFDYFSYADYTPSGATALYDAIGITITAFFFIFWTLFK